MTEQRSREREILDQRASSLVRVLEGLAADARRIRDGAPMQWPRATVSLSNGQSVSGMVVAIDDDRGAHVVMHCREYARGSDDDLTYIPLNHIVTVTVHDFMHRGAPSADAPAAPTKLELRRRLAQLTDKHAGIAFELTEQIEIEQLAAAARAATELDTVMLRISNDGDGVTALKAIKKVRLGVGDSSLVTLRDGVLDVVQSAREPLLGVALQAAIEKLI